ncbi:elongator complex protein 4 [Pseudohyphozyma bogoriensis]|nr:elongator complex protein 4 [Pseudohyphozyma bogoriensis]
MGKPPSRGPLSSFRRRVTATPIPGTRPSPYNSLPLLSTGLSSLDDLLGGGLPLSSSLLLEADTPTSYAELLLKFWVAQGVECKQDVVLVGSGIEKPLSEIVKMLPGVEGGNVKDDEEDEEEAKNKTEKLKIAFRYEGMKQHATTVAAPAPPSKETSDVYCSMFDLTTVKTLRPAEQNRLHLVDVDTLTTSSSDIPTNLYELLFARLKTIIAEGGYSLPHDPAKPRRALRIAISSFASPAWGPATSTTLYSFLHRLRTLLRTSSSSCILTLPATFYRQSNPSLLTRLSHAVDGIVELQSFADSPTSLASFPKHNGLLRIPKLPSLGSLVPPSVKLSVLRGLGGGDGGGMENNLGFRVKRRRFIIETVGGDEPVGGEAPKPKQKEKEERKEVELEGELKPRAKPAAVRFEGEKDEGAKKTKPKSVSAVMHSRPELYEF